MNSKFFTTRGDKPVLSKEYWNAWYIAERGRLKDKGQSAWGNPTKLMVDEIGKVSGDLKGKRVVILGEGDGRYSIYFAKQLGARVEHVDYSEGAIEGLREAAFANGARKLGKYEKTQQVFVFNNGIVTAFDVDVSQYTRLGGTMCLEGINLVLSSGLAEYLPPQEFAELVRCWQKATAVGGVHAIVYLAQGPGVSEIPGEHPHEPGFIESLYDKGRWRFTYEADTTREDTHIIIRPEDTTIEPDRPAETHVHRIMRFVAEKLG